MKNLVSRFVKDESGATAIEYGLIAAGIAIAIITAVNGVGSKLSEQLRHDLELAEVSDVRELAAKAPVTRGLCCFCAGAPAFGVFRGCLPIVHSVASLRRCSA